MQVQLKIMNVFMLVCQCSEGSKCYTFQPIIGAHYISLVFYPITSRGLIKNGMMLSVVDNEDTSVVYLIVLEIKCGALETEPRLRTLIMWSRGRDQFRVLQPEG